MKVRLSLNVFEYNKLNEDTPVLEMSTVEARENFSDMINKAAYGNQRVVLTRRGKPLVAVVSLEELQALKAKAGEVATESV